jgi:hypothetical protein
VLLPEATMWQKSPFCASATCVEIAVVGSNVAIRDSKKQDGPFLVVTREQWHDFAAGLRDNSLVVE